MIWNGCVPPSPRPLQLDSGEPWGRASPALLLSLLKRRLLPGVTEAEVPGAHPAGVMAGGGARETAGELLLLPHAARGLLGSSASSAEPPSAAASGPGEREIEELTRRWPETCGARAETDAGGRPGCWWWWWRCCRVAWATCAQAAAASAAAASPAERWLAPPPAAAAASTIASNMRTAPWRSRARPPQPIWTQRACAKGSPPSAAATKSGMNSAGSFQPASVPALGESGVGDAGVRLLRAAQHASRSSHAASAIAAAQVAASGRIMPRPLLRPAGADGDAAATFGARTQPWDCTRAARGWPGEG